MESKDGIARSKVEEDIEKHVLSTTVKLSDGTVGNVFSRGARNEFQVFLYNCHVCGVPNLPGERCLQTHISGRKHQMRLAQGVIDATAFRAPMQAKSKIQMHIAPGEPVPPGFENEVKLIAELQSVLDRNREDNYVGLEYLMELTGARETSYHCTLCDKRGDPCTILSHLVSYNHRLKYLDKHYPSCVREFGEFRYQKEARPVLTKVIQSICAAIEETHGRLTPSVHDKDEYERNKMKYLTEVISEKHFDEKTGPKFVKLVDKVKIADMIRRSKISLNLRKRTSSPDTEMMRGGGGRERLDSVSSISSSSMKSGSRSPRAKRSRRRRSKSASPKVRNSARSDRVERLDFRRRPKDSDEKVNKRPFPTPEELSRQANEIQEERYKWEKYRCLVEKAVEDLSKVAKEHEKNPEKHPLYPEEWKRFWNRRYKELQQEKKDPAKHDFKPEWIKFWTHRMKELHEEEIDEKKREIRAKVGLPLEEERKLPVSSVEVIKILDSPDSIEMGRKGSLSPLSDDGGRKIRISPRRSRARSPRSKSPSRRRSRSRSRRSRSYSPSKRSYSPRSRERSERSDRYYERSSVRYAPPPDPYYNFEEWASYYGPHKSRPVFGRSATSAYPEAPEEPETDEPLTVVSVLRLLTALEEHLGSLGPKCIDLLAKALALEKVKANSADEMLVNEDTCTFFETTKEKLKGQILAGVMEAGKVKAVKKAIKNIAALIHMVTKKREERANGEAKEAAAAAKESDKVEAKAAVATPGLDRSKISLKLSAELSTQGRDDITQIELEQLVLVFVGMLQRSKQTGDIVTVRDFLEENDVRLVRGGEKTMVDIKKTVEEEFNFKEDATAQSDANALESLTDSDLQTLLQNFKDLSSEEQHHLISYLKKLEATDPTRVEKLRKFVNLDVGEKRKASSSQDTAIAAPDERTEVLPKAKEKRIQSIYDSEDDDDDDDDYNFDDVVKAASKNVKEKQMQDRMKVVQESLQQKSSLEETSSSGGSTNPVTNVSAYSADAQALIANIMGSLQKNVARTSQSGEAQETANAGGMNSLPYYQQATAYDSYGAPQANSYYQGFGMQNSGAGLFPSAGAMNPGQQPIFPNAQQQQQQQQASQWQNSTYNKYY
ncbi:uncharacterized protein CG7065-like [Phlebotomus argentipes]|uniref:uncharacterized protein CG7065-like n=1 Tax=Phlebotomus argentipes TaxID=94469 RepID=UPI002892B7F3|nr:uncharacterized protein CG7065-like [Phlebotomus argentipes]XP_059608343.1 uncharacterized protein CG7065-like [Phlebotomus argentipes]